MEIDFPQPVVFMLSSYDFMTIEFMNRL